MLLSYTACGKSLFLFQISFHPKKTPVTVECVLNTKARGWYALSCSPPLLVYRRCNAVCFSLKHLRVTGEPSLVRREAYSCSALSVSLFDLRSAELWPAPSVYTPRETKEQEGARMCGRRNGNALTLSLSLSLSLLIRVHCETAMTCLN